MGGEKEVRCPPYKRGCLGGKKKREGNGSIYESQSRLKYEQGEKIITDVGYIFKKKNS